MPELMNEETREKLVEVLAEMRWPVTLLLFTEGDPSPASEMQQEILESVVSLADNLHLEVYNARDHAEELETYRIDRLPATVPIGGKDYGIRFFGVTAGQEFSSFLQTIIMISTGYSGLAPEFEVLVANIAQPVHIRVFVTLTCPYCPAMVHLAHQFAYVNEAIRADAVEGSQFPDLVSRYQVEGVPRTIINETTVLDGAHPEGVFYLSVLQAADPEEYRRIEAAMRDMQGVRKVSPLDESRVYDILIVGGGPAAMSAALYAARKNLDVGLVAEKIGGQMTYTAHIENYLGFPGVGGDELLQRFQFHVESYPISELLDVKVTAVEEAGQGFAVHTDDGRRFSSHAVIYCAGKEYTRLGVPNEDRFIGYGIAFCATCDAPLYAGRRVAVVGGANSAFTAVRDLVAFAKEIHLIHRRDTFKADAALVEEIRDHPAVTFHTPYRVLSFSGDERLAGIEIRPVDGGEPAMLEVDGVFLEIGLSPNTEPVAGTIPLNERGEVLVNPDRSTKLSGFFAAGDVTDVAEKQISVAVGDGALAALTAYKYLLDEKLVARASTADDWA